MSRIKSKTTGYEYKPFEESDETIRKRAEFQNLAKPQQQGFTMQDQLDNTWNQIMNRKDFGYDLNGDALYQQYKDKYIQQGQMAMKNTIGKASQMTGGYGNSYATTAGNLAYQASLQQLNDVVPELYQLAYNKYSDEGNELKNKYAMLTDKETTEYSRYQDALADYYNQYGLLSSEEDKLYNRDYNNWMNQENAKQNIAQSDRDYLHQVNRESIADKQWQQQFNASEDSREFQEWLSKQNLQLNQDQFKHTKDMNFKNMELANKQFDASEDSRVFQEWLSKQNLQLSQDQFKHTKDMDFNNVELANKQYVLELGKQGMEREEHEMLMEKYDNAKKSGTVSDYIGKITPVDIANTITAFRLDDDMVGLEAFLSDLTDRGIITEQQYDDYCYTFDIKE